MKDYRLIHNNHFFFQAIKFLLHDIFESIKKKKKKKKSRS